MCGDNKGRVHILMSNGLETTPKDYDRRDGPHMHFKLHHVSHHVEQLHAFDAATVWPISACPAQDMPMLLINLESLSSSS